MEGIISLLGLPGSGKSTHGERLSELRGLRFVEESGTQLIHEKGYSIGVDAPLEFDRDVLKRNLKIGREILESEGEVIVWEGSPYTDKFYLEGRSRFGRKREARRKLLEEYENELFRKLKRKTTFVIFDISPEMSMSRQERRGKSELTTPQKELVNFVSQKLSELRNKNEDRTVVLDASKSQNEVFEEFIDSISL